MSLRESIFKAKDYTLTDISIPEWGPDGTFYLRPLSGTERIEFENMHKTSERDAVLHVCVSSLVDRDGQNVFLESDKQELGKKNGIIIDRIFSKALKVSGMLPSSVEEAEKN